MRVITIQAVHAIRADCFRRERWVRGMTIERLRTTAVLRRATVVVERIRIKLHRGVGHQRPGMIQYVYPGATLRIQESLLIAIGIGDGGHTAGIFIEGIGDDR